MKKNQPSTLLGGISVESFLSDYWQKKPLLIRQAIPNFSGILSPNDLAGLACEDDIQARIVIEKKSQWQLKHGPFSDEDFATLPKKNWTLLVQNVDHYLPQAKDLLEKFNFIPNARLDDLMVSYAPEGGGVGPHFDSYDVFLLQGQGKRCWRVSTQDDLTLLEGAPMRILKNFYTEQEWVLEAGDMLYLPPKAAHWGIALPDKNDCMTYSIGFRAPKHHELATEFLGYLQDQFAQEKLFLAGIYEDTDLTLQENPAEISTQMIEKVAEILQKITWDTQIVRNFIGSYLTEPKQHVIFEPHKNISLEKFSTKLNSKGIALDLKTQLLFKENNFYMNGEFFSADENCLSTLKQLAKDRYLSPDYLNKNANPFLQELLFAWYLAGYCHTNA
jgi:50S ribosomal protein L16 3-hydroxylase